MNVPMQSKHRGLGDVTPVQQLVVAAATKYNIPPDLLLAQANQESGFNQSAISSVGAIGVMQLMPATAKDLGVDPYNLQQNIDGGAKYLSQQYAKFGDWNLALAAYNAGAGNVQKYGDTVPPFPETQNYVSKIMASISSFASTAAELLGIGSPTIPTPVIPTMAVSGPQTDTGGTDATDILGQPTDSSGSSQAGILSGDSNTLLWVAGAAVIGGLALAWFSKS